MNKTMVVAVIVFSALSFTTMSFAQSMMKKPKAQNAVKTDTVSGKIVSMDQAKSQVVIKNASGMEKTVMVDSKEMASLKVGDDVVALLPSGSNKVQTIKKMLAKTKKAY